MARRKQLMLTADQWRQLEAKLKTTVRICNSKVYDLSLQIRGELDKGKPSQPARDLFNLAAEIRDLAECMTACQLTLDNMPIFIQNAELEQAATACHIDLEACGIGDWKPS